MVNYSYKKIEKLLDNLPNWYKAKIDPKILKSLMQRSDGPAIIKQSKDPEYYVVKKLSS